VLHVKKKKLIACAILQENRNTTGEANITPAKFFAIRVGMETREAQSSQLAGSVGLQHY
jgi:hypothetical protein